MNIHRVLTAMAMTAAITASGILVDTGAAWAAKDDCRDGAMCLWSRTAFRGELVFLFEDESAPDLTQSHPWLNDNVRSVWNRIDEPWCLYQHPNYTGISKKLSWKEAVSDMNSSVLKYRTSSLRPC